MKKTPEEIIAAAKKQQYSTDAIEAVTSPVKTLVKKGAKAAYAGPIISNEELIEAIVLKVLKEQGLLPVSNIQHMIDKSIKKHAPKHPFWTSYMSRSRRNRHNHKPIV